jgi:hypothetical protein
MVFVGNDTQLLKYLTSLRIALVGIGQHHPQLCPILEGFLPSNYVCCPQYYDLEETELSDPGHGPDDYGFYDC